MIAARPKLAVKELNAAYGRAHILYDVALDVGASEAVALVGRNGAGKSTTLRSILGLIANCEARLFSTARRSRTFPPTSACGAGSDTCRRTAASSPT